MASNIPEHMTAEAKRSKRFKHLVATTMLLLWGFVMTTLPGWAWLVSQPANRTTMSGVSDYLHAVLRSPFAETSAAFYDQPLLIVWGAIGSFTCLIALALVALRLNPHRDVFMTHGDARFANKRDLELMNEKKQIGPAGKYLDFGTVGGQRIRLIETLSVLLLAPPGTGKTVKFIVPALLSPARSCFIVHDPKPELWQICSGYRASQGPTYNLNWSRSDNPAAGEWHPKFNFLDRSIVPERGGDRDTFIDALSSSLIPDPKNGGDGKYFIDAGRGALRGFLQYLVAQINDDWSHNERETDPDAYETRYEGIPDRWRGKPASLPMLVEWLAQSQQESLARHKEAAARNPNRPPGDPYERYFTDLIDHCDERGYPPRIKTELQPLVMMADKERSGVLGTMNQGLIPFRNQAVAERTSDSDFVPTDLGGMLSDAALARLGCERYPRQREDWDAIRDRIVDADWEPVSVFVCINQRDAPAFENITALFFRLLSLELLSYEPGEITRQGAMMGPFPKGFIMEELAKMARCDEILDGPDLGRAKRVYYLLCAQDIEQLKRRYSDEQKKAIISTTAVKLILEQNSPETVKEIAQMVGETTTKRKSKSRNTGIKESKVFGGNVSEQVEHMNLLTPTLLTSMPPNKHIVLAQGFMTRPLLCLSTTWFNDDEMKTRGYSKFTGEGIPEAPPLPERCLAGRRAEVAERRSLVERERLRERMMYWIDPDLLDCDPTKGP